MTNYELSISYLTNKRIGTKEHPWASDTLFTIGNWNLKIYSVMIMLGILGSILAICYFWKRQKYSFEFLHVLILIVIPTALICARLWHVIYASTDKVNYPNFNLATDWYKIWQGGIAIQGAVIGAAIAGIIYCFTKRKLIDVKTAADFILPAVLIGQAIGRWGNFYNHEVYGKVDENGSFSIWLGKFISDNMFIAQDDGLGHHFRVPLFFYESITSILGTIILVFILNVFNWQRPGMTSGGYFLWYGIVRLIMEPMRDPTEAMLWGSLNAGIFTSVVYIFVGIFFIIIAIPYIDIRFKAFVKLMIYKMKKKPQNQGKENLTKKSFDYFLEKQKYPYQRIKVEQRWFFILWPLKITVLFNSLFSALFEKGKIADSKFKKKESFKKIKGNSFTLVFKKLFINIIFIGGCIFSIKNYNLKKEEKIIKFSKLRCMKWKFASYIWVKENELEKFKEKGV